VRQTTNLFLNRGGDAVNSGVVIEEGLGLHLVKAVNARAAESARITDHDGLHPKNLSLDNDPDKSLKAHRPELRAQCRPAQLCD